MTHRDQADTAVDELQLVGGEATREGHELTVAAAAAGLNVRWLDFASEDAQAAIAAQGGGAVRLPLVIVGGTHTLQRPPFTAVSACLAALRAGDGALPVDAIPVRNDRRYMPKRRTQAPTASLWTVIGVAA